MNPLAMIAVLAIFVAPPEKWIPQNSGTDARLRGVSVVGKDVAWASGTKGTVLRTTDGGETWRAKIIPDSTDLDFRDIHAFDAQRAVVLAIGPGEKSRIYKTADGGDTWSLRHTNRDPKGFLDAIAFWDTKHGLALGDPVDGRFTILATDDGGDTWHAGDAAGMPPALEKEGAFAASGTCLIAQGDKNAWFGTGGGAAARVFRSTDRGRTWTAHDTPIAAGGPTLGIFSLAFRDAAHGVAVGGAYDQPDRKDRVAARTDDGGKTWAIADAPGPAGFRSAVAYAGDRPGLVAFGPSGADRSSDDGRTWHPVDAEGFHAVGFAGQNGWAVGENGKIAKFAG